MRRLIFLQTPTIFWLGEEPFLSALEQTEIRTAETLVPELNAFGI